MALVRNSADNYTDSNMSYSLRCDQNTTANESVTDHGSNLPLLVTTDWLSAFAVFRLIAMLTNFAFVLAVYADKTSKAGPRLLIGNLAVCGFLFCISVFPMYIAQEWTRPELFPSPCLSVAPSMFFVTAISWADVSLCINRSVAICLPHYYDSFRRYRTTWALIVGSWAVSVFASSVIGTETGVTFVTMGKNSTYCSLNTTNFLGNFSVALCIPIPYFVIGVACLVIFSTAHAKKHSPPRNAGEAARLKRLIDRRLVFVKAMLVSLIWNVICSIPVLLTSSVPAENVRAHTLMTNLSGFSPGLLYAINPLIYFWISPAYRRSFRSLVFRSSRRLPGQVGPSGTGGDASTSQNQQKSLQSRNTAAS